MARILSTGVFPLFITNRLYEKATRYKIQHNTQRTHHRLMCLGQRRARTHRGHGALSQQINIELPQPLVPIGGGGALGDVPGAREVLLVEEQLRPLGSVRGRARGVQRVGVDRACGECWESV